MYRRMRKALIREIAPVTVLDWVEAEEYVLSQYQSMRFRNWQLHAQRNPYEWFNQAAAPVALRGGSKSELRFESRQFSKE